MAENNYNASELISRGDVVIASGNTVEELFSSICANAKLPSGIAPDTLVKELMARESVLSTAVGNGIAIPHPRRPLVANNEEGCIIVAYINSPIDMQAPDSKKVHTMFILLSASSQAHVKALSSLAAVIRNDGFKKGIMTRPLKDDLVQLVYRYEL